MELHLITSLFYARFLGEPVGLTINARLANFQRGIITSASLTVS
ncbi:hypothetical protein ABI_45430 [Asticcacaulis biprosthecium C19]|uniref:Uncharacterized protein n=1 Tax=Asticcacaulis biprosthecium C19 TaxID=715226 RepID=F4QTP7_9CAUL|nr:hypothetical protein ABI_45430 [Asticcacaulis biprosthecium C19]